MKLLERLFLVLFSGSSLSNRSVQVEEITNLVKGYRDSSIEVTAS